MQDLPRPAYSFTATYAYSTHTLEVSELITYTNPSAQAFNQLLLVVEANRYPGSLSIQSIHADGQALGGYTLEDNRLSLPLLRPLTASFGVALLQPEEKREAFYARAGRAVRFSKEHGKNCIAIAGVVAECDHLYQGAAQETN